MGDTELQRMDGQILRQFDRSWRELWCSMVQQMHSCFRPHSESHLRLLRVDSLAGPRSNHDRWQCPMNCPNSKMAFPERDIPYLCSRYDKVVKVYQEVGFPNIVTSMIPAEALAFPERNIPYLCSRYDKLVKVDLLEEVGFPNIVTSMIPVEASAFQERNIPYVQDMTNWCKLTKRLGFQI